MIKRINFLFEKLRNIFIKNKFTYVYRNNLFQGKESRSGEGSNLIQTTIIRKKIPLLIEELNIKSLTDAPCGDFFWMRHVELPVEKYIGVDVVKAIIEINQNKYSNEQRSFTELNIIKDIIPRSDMILCRDCLVHLSFKQGIRILENFKMSGSKYLLITTFVDRTSNKELGKGFWRTINIEKDPFNLPKPIQLINEGCTEFDGRFTDKSLGLFLLEDVFKHVNVSI